MPPSDRIAPVTKKVRGDGGFQPIGRVAVDALGLPSSRARLLLLEHAWGRVAGDAIARRTRAVPVRRGVLSVSVDDAAWAREIVPLLPRIAGRLAREFPGLGVKRFRVSSAAGPGSPLEIPELEDSREADPAVASGPAAPASEEREEVTTGRLVRAAHGYLLRSEPDRARDE